MKCVYLYGDISAGHCHRCNLTVFLCQHVTVTLAVPPSRNVTKPAATASAWMAFLVHTAMSVLADSPGPSLTVATATSVLLSGTRSSVSWPIRLTVLSTRSMPSKPAESADHTGIPWTAWRGASPTSGPSSTRTQPRNHWPISRSCCNRPG